MINKTVFFNQFIKIPSKSELFLGLGHSLRPPHGVQYHRVQPWVQVQVQPQYQHLQLQRQGPAGKQIFVRFSKIHASSYTYQTY